MGEGKRLKAKGCNGRNGRDGGRNDRDGQGERAKDEAEGQALASP